MDISQKILSDITVYSKYARYDKDKKRRETYEEIVDRNKQMHIKRFPHLKDEIEQAYISVYEKKLLPSMRSFQFAGKPIEISPSRIYNCAFVPVDDWRVFHEVMFLLLGGTGVGYSVQKHHIEKLPEIVKPNPDRKRRYLIGDSIEGWADAIKVLMKSYFQGGSTIRFDFSDIRPKGAELITSGGKAPGPQPLKECLVKIDGILSQKEQYSKLKPIEVHDIICHIADAVLAGGIRRAALIALFSADDQEMIACKSGAWWELNPQRGRANNSAVLMRNKITREFFDSLWQKIIASNSGEPGIYFTNDKEFGTNPCCEIALRNNQFCNLTEINANLVDSQEDFDRVVRDATIIGTLQASYTDFHYLRPIWQRNTEKDALLGIGITGWASRKLDSIDLSKGVEIAKEVNKEWAKKLGINTAARITTVKPSGTSSMVLSSSSGIHAWHDDYYIRRMRIGKNEALYQYLAVHHPELVEDEYFRPETMAVISVPQKAPDNAIIRSDESPIQLLDRVKKVHLEWVNPGHISGSNTNNVSATISVKDDEWGEVVDWMWENRDHYNGLSVLPYDGGTYTQAPFESITKEQYEEMVTHLTNIDLTKVIEDQDNTDLKGEIACGANGCEII